MTEVPTARAVIAGVPFYGEGGNGIFLVFPSRALLPPIATSGTRAYTIGEDDYVIFIAPDSGIGGHWADDVRGQQLAEKARRNQSR